jgi:hypothetical protein
MNFQYLTQMFVYDIQIFAQDEFFFFICHVLDKILTKCSRFFFSMFPFFKLIGFLYNDDSIDAFC